MTEMLDGMPAAPGADDGTGLVHQSPAFGEPDLEVARAYGLPVITPVQANGRFEDTVPLVGELAVALAGGVTVGPPARPAHRGAPRRRTAGARGDRAGGHGPARHP